MTKTPPKEKPIIIPASMALKKKVGSGGIPDRVLKKAQTFLESNPVDFVPYAVQYLEDLIKIREKIKTNDTNPNETIRVIGNNVMQMKSNGSMFHFQLVSMISDVMLRFMDHVKKTDEDFIEILDVYLKILDTILKKRIAGNGGKEGEFLTKELQKACTRYYKRNDIQI